MDLFLRIAPELYLKRLVVGGFDRVYEINRNFRNEGISTQHNPEFTMLEFYQAYANYKDLMGLTQELIEFVAREVNGSTVTRFGGVEIDLSKWERLTMREAIIKWWWSGMQRGPSLADFASSESLVAFLSANASLVAAPENDARVENRAFFLGAWCAEAARRVTKGEPYGKIIAELFEHVAEENLIQPTIIYEFPLAVSPLSKQKPDEPDWVERFEFYIGGFELGNAFSELNDPEEQRRRFEEQVAQHARGDEEAHQMDVDYVRALAHGMPPTAGEGIGIDRLTMILTGAKSIRDVILFPLLKPQAEPSKP
jgi:lysyl-tRNA synthetase class 2